MSQLIDLSRRAYDNCELCPRHCKAKRTSGQKGFCGENSTIMVARSALHFWEEPPISGTAGSGTIFFSGCPLRCKFCQNHSISQEGFGLEVTPRRLAKMMLELQEQGALNINLVTALHFAPHLIEAIDLARTAGLTLPIVCNTSGYERAELVAALIDHIDIWLTDFKYASKDLALSLSVAANYPEVAEAALKQMLLNLAQKGGRKMDASGRMLQGIIVRHLILPGQTEDSKAVLRRLWNLAENQIDLSIMNQYTPNDRVKAEGGELARPVTAAEYEEVLNYADDLGFDKLWWQQGGTVSESFIPAFDATGVKGAEL